MCILGFPACLRRAAAVGQAKGPWRHATGGRGSRVSQDTAATFSWRSLRPVAGRSRIGSILCARRIAAMRILFVYGSMASFTRSDLGILRSAHTVRELHFRREVSHVLPSLIASVLGAIWADAIVSWFGSAHALAPFMAGHLLGRKCIVVAGGYDVACEPAIEYGNMRGGLRRLVGRLVFRFADRVLAVSQSAAREAVDNANVPAAKVEVIEHGIGCTWSADVAPGSVDRRTVLTVSIVNEGNLSRKGLTTFVETARHLPDVPFVLVGSWEDDAVEQLRALASPNVEFTGRESDADLRARMEEAAVYVQVSFHEAFGVALAEAMLCGCVPVVTRRGSLPEVVGETGMYVPFGDAVATAQAVRSALSRPELGEQARQRVRSRFSPSLRRARLLAALMREGEDREGQ